MKSTRACPPNSSSSLYLGIVISLWVLARTASAAITGTVVDDTGNPVAAARVLISHSASGPRFAAPPTVTGPLATTTVTDQTGSFVVADLAPGEYVACAQTTPPGLLDPCHWAASAPTFVVAVGQPTQSLKIVMTKGAVVPIHVADPTGVLSNSVTSAMAPTFQIHVVTGKGLHYNAPVQAQSATSWDYAATVPYNIPLSIRVVSAGALVADQAGNALPSGGSPVTILSGATPSPITFTITGVNTTSISATAPSVSSTGPPGIGTTNK